MRQLEDEEQEELTLNSSQQQNKTITNPLENQIFGDQCPACSQELGTNGYLFHGLKFKESIDSFSFGEIGCILKRKHLISVVTIVFILFAIYFRIGLGFQRYVGQREPILFPNTDGWDKFIKKCGYLKITGSRRDYMDCQGYYLDNTMMNWEGWVIRVEDNRNSLYQYFTHASTILIQMEPQESEYNADVKLTMDSYQMEEFDSVLQNIERGNRVRFNATLKAIGDVQQIRHFHTNGIEIIEGHKEIAPHLHDKSRYSKSNVVGENKKQDKKDGENTSGK